MGTLLCVALFAAISAAGAEPVAWGELALTIEEDRSVSSDQATLCRVRVVNHGRTTWQGRRISFEAVAVRDGRVAARQRGRFGLTLSPHETLETIVGFVGRFDRFEVSPAAGSDAARGSGKASSARRSGKGRAKRPRRK